MCLGCGFDGAAIQSDLREGGWTCPRCAADLYARPPRSYADMEGLNDAASAPAPVSGRPRAAVRGKHVAPIRAVGIAPMESRARLLGPVLLSLTAGTGLGGLVLWALVVFNVV